jgi:hypothetical protein
MLSSSCAACLLAGPAEAMGAINFIQTLLNDNDWSFAQGKFELDPASLQFLLRSGYETLAIRYYRERTDVSLIEAYRLVQEMSNKIRSGAIYRVGAACDALPPTR